MMAAVVGVGATGWLLTMLWPEPDQVAKGAPPSLSDPTSLAPFPESPVTVLVIGVDADRLTDPSNQAAPRGPANADALLLMRVEANASLQVLQLPTELAVRLPGRTSPMTLSSVWKAGGVALTADAVREIVGLPAEELQRYVVLPRQSLRALVDGLGEVDVILSQSYQRSDKTQGYKIDLQAGHQSLNGAQAEQLVRYKKDDSDEVNRRERQQMLMRAMLEQLQAPSGIVSIGAVLNEINLQLDTNLSLSEMLSLAAAVIASPSRVSFTQLSLAPRAGKQALRQLKPGQTLPLWPQP
tara:strand:- start:2902 stop:3792 length:891 start_codon:yes stop_codon:yes gene_type:complete